MGLSSSSTSQSSERQDIRKDEGEPSAAPAEASVGVLGWLGFLIINGAAWGIISTSSWINWVLGLGFCVVYTALLIGGAFWLDRRGQRYRQFVNLFWVLGLLFAGIVGIYISVRIIGPAVDGKGLFDDSSSNNNPNRFDAGYLNANELEALLPSGASQPLRSWARDRSSRSASTFAVFAGNLIFRGTASADTYREVLWRSNGTSASKVSPEMYFPRDFTEFQSDLFFLARAANSNDGLWRVTAATSENASLVVQPNTQGADLQSLFADSNSTMLYFKASWTCPGPLYLRVNTIFSSNGTAAGTTDLRGDPCAVDSNSTNTTGSPSDDELPIGALWGTLLLACLPMAGASVVIILWKKMPGPVVNLFAGTIGAVISLYLIAQGTSNLANFLKWFITLYTGVLWVVIAVWSLLRPKLSEWKEELKTWAVAIVGVSFFVIIHIDLEIPFRSEAWRWVIYAFVSILQMVLSAIVSRTVPMVAGSAGAFVLSWKIAYELVEFADFGGSELKMLTTLALVALQGIGIVASAIFYAGRRNEIDGAVRSLLQCRKPTWGVEASADTLLESPEQALDQRKRSGRTGPSSMPDQHADCPFGRLRGPTCSSLAAGQKPTSPQPRSASRLGRVQGVLVAAS